MEQLFDLMERFVLLTCLLDTNDYLQQSTQTLKGGMIAIISLLV